MILCFANVSICRWLLALFIVTNRDMIRRYLKKEKVSKQMSNETGDTRKYLDLISKTFNDTFECI